MPLCIYRINLNIKAERTGSSFAPHRRTTHNFLKDLYAEPTITSNRTLHLETMHTNGLHHQELAVPEERASPSPLTSDLMNPPFGRLEGVCFASFVFLTPFVVDVGLLKSVKSFPETLPKPESSWALVPE